MKKYDAEIFKIQRPLISNEGNIALCYNQDRSILCRFPITKELSKLFKKNEFKIYVVGYLDDKGIIQIVRKITEKINVF